MQSLETILVHANITILPAFFNTYLALLYVYGVWLWLDNSWAVDYDNSTALQYHHACRGAKYETIAMLLEISREAFSIPIDILLLLESNANAVEDRESESDEYIESVFRLLKAYPKTVITNCYVFE